VFLNSLLWYLHYHPTHYHHQHRPIADVTHSVPNQLDFLGLPDGMFERKIEKQWQ
jgi:hypothetical protein